MDIRTKLVFTLVAVSLGSMLTLGVITYSSARRLLIESTRDQLAGLADTKVARVEALISDWHDQARLAASPSQLRVDLREYSRTGDRAAAARVRNVLDDALGAVDSFESLAVYDAEGRLVAGVERDDGSRVPDSLVAVTDPTVAPVLIGTRLSGGRPYVSFASSLALEGEFFGFLRLSIDGGELLNVTGNRGGLGETGETLIVGRDESGIVRALTPLRHPPEDGSVPEQIGDPARRALAGEEGEFVEGMVDYRGEPVWAATRYLPETQWGLVVKFDAAEEVAPIAELRSDLTELGVALAAFAILLGIVAGFRFAKPIHDLAATWPTSSSTA